MVRPWFPDLAPSSSLRVLISALPICLAWSGAQALTITPFNSAGNLTTLTTALQAVNSGITITSSSFIGVNNQAGTYSGFNLTSTAAGKPAVVANDGILLTNGTANIPLTNTLTNFGVTTNSGSNAQLSALSASAGGSATTNDQNVLSVTFTVNDLSNNAVRADFIYGSDEYPETSVTDIFGFFVDGTNYAFFPDQSLVSFKPSNASNFNDNTDGSYGIEYDGISNLLTINGLLNTNLTVHTLTIAIADTDDSIFDSGAFLSNLQSAFVTTGGISAGATINTTGGDIASNIFGLGSPAAMASTVQFNGGTLRMIGGTFAGNVVTAPVTIDSNNGTVDTSSGNGGFSGVVSGVGSLTIAGGGTFSLSGANTYAGGTILDGSTVLVGNDSALGTGPVTLNGGTLRNAPNTDRNLGNAILIGPGGGTIDDNGAGLRLAGNISDATGGTGTVTFANSLGGNVFIELAGANSFTGGAVVKSGAFVLLDTPNALGAGALEVDAGARVDLGSQNQAVTALSGAGAIYNSGFNGPPSGISAAVLSVQSGAFSGSIADGAALVTTSTGTQTFLGIVGLNKMSDGSVTGGTLTLSGASSYSGVTMVSGGTLKAGSSTAFSAASPYIVQAAGTLDLGGFDNEINSLQGSGRVTNSGPSPADLTLGRAGDSTTFSGLLSDGAGPLAITKMGGGTLTLTGANTFSGGSLLKAGAVQATNGQSLGTGAIVFDGGRVQALVGGGSLTLANAIQVGPGGGTIDANLANVVTLTGGITGLAGAGPLTYKNTGGDPIATSASHPFDIEVAGSATFTGGTIISSGVSLVDLAENAIGTGNLEVDAGAQFSLGAHNQSIADLTGAGRVSADGYLSPTGFMDSILSVQSGSFAGRLSDGTSSTGSQSFSGTLGLTKVSDGSASGGTLLLSGASGYSGPTQVLGGTLLAGSTTALSSRSALTVSAGAALDLGGFSNTVASLAGAGKLTNSGTAGAMLTTGGDGTTTTFSGAIADGVAPLALAKVGAGTLNLTGASSYSGGTMLDAGLLGIGSGAALGSGPLSMAPGTGLVMLGSFTVANRIDLASAGDPTIDTGANTVTLSNVISGPGELTKLGSGTLDLTAVNTYTGPTVVQQGTLLVDGSIASSSSVTLEAGAGIGGKGTISSLIVQSGATVAPGSATPFSNLSIGGNVTFQAGSTFRVTIDPAGKTDSLSVAGAATINGGTVDVQAAAGAYLPSLTYRILTASGGLSGQFTNLTASADLAFLTPTLSYSATAVTLGLSQTAALASAAVTPNQQAVANAIQGLPPGNALFNAVVSQTLAGAQQAFQATTGEAHASAPAQAVAGVRLASGIIFDRLWNVQGNGGSDAVSVLDQFGPTTLPALLRCYTPVTEPGKETPAMYSVWAQGIGSFGRNIGDGNASSVKSTLGGFAFGADTKIDAKGFDNWRVGVAGGYTNTAFTVKSGGSNSTYENIFGTLYAGARYGAVDVRLGASYGGTATNLRRTVAFPGFNETERSSNDGSTVQGFGEVGYRLSFGQTVVEPVVGGSITHVHQDAFREKGGAAALVGAAQDTDVGSTTVGVRGEAVPVAEWPLVARLFLGWQHAYGDVNPASTVAFAAGPTQFQTYGTPLDRNSVVAETGVDYRATGALSIGIAYTGQAGHRDRNNAVKGRMEYRF